MSARIITATLLILAIVAAAALADEPAEKESPSRMVIVGDDDEKITVTLDDGELVITSEDEDGTSVHMVDMTQIGMMVGEALEGLDEVLAGMADMQLDMHMGNDNRLNLSWEDETFELDVNEIMVQVNEALSEGLAEIRSEDWTSVHARDRSERELREELRELKAELRELRREIRDLDDDD